MIFNVIALVIGLLILAAGIYYFAKEKVDAESRRIYGIAIGAGIILTAFALARLFLL